MVKVGSRPLSWFRRRFPLPLLLLQTRPHRDMWFRLAFVSAYLLLKLNATSTKAPPHFAIPESAGLDNVNVLIGNGGDTPNGSGGMIPSTSPPFGMTRWVAQTQVHFVSATPFNWTLDKVMGVVGTRQPAIWMGESAPISVDFGVGDIKFDFHERGLNVVRDETRWKNETATISYYNVLVDDSQGGQILVEQTASAKPSFIFFYTYIDQYPTASRVAHLRLTFRTAFSPYIMFEVARPSIITSTPSNITYPPGSVTFVTNREICGFSTERQDTIITPISIAPAASNFKGYFCARFDEDTPDFQFGTNQNGTTEFPLPINSQTTGPLLRAFVKLPPDASTPERTITLRIGTSFISEAQASRNIDLEIPDVDGVRRDGAHNDVHLVPGTFENTAYRVRKSWADILDRIVVEPYINKADQVGDDRALVDLESFWTGVVHTLQVRIMISGYNPVIMRILVPKRAT